MSLDPWAPAPVPTFYFIGVSTSRSSILKVFPQWAAELGLGPCPIRGIDCRPHDDPAVYRQVVSFLKHDPLSLGGLVTTHKIDLLRAARDLFDELDSQAQLLGEVSSISKREGRLVGHAKDPLTSGLSLQDLAPDGYWRESGADLCLLGAGGSSLALTAHLMQLAEPCDRPRRIVVTNRSPGRLEEMRAIHQRIHTGIQVEYALAPRPEENDRVLAGLAPGSLVANATGLGKDAPGSPLTDAAVFPRNGLAWDFNYRGELRFLEQARVQQAARNLRIADGWTYFLHGWTRVIAEVFHREIPTAGPRFERLATLAAGAR